MSAPSACVPEPREACARDVGAVGVAVRLSCSAVGLSAAERNQVGVAGRRGCITSIQVADLSNYASCSRLSREVLSVAEWTAEATSQSAACVPCCCAATEHQNDQERDSAHRRGAATADPAPAH